MRASGPLKPRCRPVAVWNRSGLGTRPITRSRSPSQPSLRLRGRLVRLCAFLRPADKGGVPALAYRWNSWSGVACRWRRGHPHPHARGQLPDTSTADGIGGVLTQAGPPSPLRALSASAAAALCAKEMLAACWTVQDKMAPPASSYPG